MENTTAWLASLGLGEYAQRFLENDIDISVLADLSDQDLKELGVSLGHRKKMLRSIAERAERARASATAAEPAPQDAAERRQLTVMFCDLVGSTALSARLDPEEMREVMRAYHGACARVIPTYDGFIAKFMGDGILAYFGYPRAHEDDAARAVRAGLDIVAAVDHLKTAAHEPLQVRVGIATGLVVVGDLIGEGVAQEKAVVGDTPNLAARLQVLAEPGAVVVAATTRRLIGSHFKVRDLEAQAIKGFAEPVKAWAVEGTLSSESRFDADRAARPVGFIGREAEIEQLLERQRLAWAGEGQIVLVTGEAGIGKSRLGAWLWERVADQPHTRLRYQCSPYHSNSALYPFIAQMERAAGFEPGDSAEERLDKLEALIAQSTPQAATAAPLFAALLSLPFAGRYQPLGLSPAQQRRQTFAALLDQLETIAAREPILFVFEDAHWADATSLELLDLAVDRVRRLPVLALVTFRPEFQPPWTGLPNVLTMTLGRLDRAHVQTMVERVTGGRSLPGEVMAQIFAKTDGIPLFVEELTKTVLESGILRERAGGYRLEAPLLPFAIPATLHDSLMARLDRLAPVKEIAQIGAAIGREFSHALLRDVSARDEASLSAALAQLEEAELVYRSGDPPDAVYTFKHALVQDTAYESMLKSRRQLLHGRIAEVLRERFPTIAETEPEVVARHVTQAGLTQEGVEWWGKAGERALRRSAFVEAIAHLGKALDLAAGVTANAAQRLMRLRLQITYANALINARGPAALETTAAFARARELAVDIEDANERFSAYYGVWVGSGARAELTPMRELSEAFLRDAESRPDSPEAGVAHRVYGATLWFQGDFVGARRHLERAVEIYDFERDRPLVFRFGQDVGVTATLYLATALWPLGEIARARTMAAAGHAFALKSGHIPTVAHAEGHLAMYESLRRDAARAMSHGRAAVSISSEHGLPLWLAMGTFHGGWARSHDGDTIAGKKDMKQGMAFFREQGFAAYMPLNEVLLAEAEAQAGDFGAALTILNDALAEAERTGQHWYDAEIYLQLGQIFMRRDRANLVGAEAAFMNALKIARSQQTRTFGLRAALALARLHQAAGRSEAARAALGPALADFADGAELAEFGEAERLLASIA